MRRIIIIVGILMMGAILLSGCSQSTTQAVVTPTIPASGVVQTDVGEIRIIPVCEYRTVCFQYNGVGIPSWAPMSCVSEGQAAGLLITPIVVSQVCGP